MDDNKKKKRFSVVLFVGVLFLFLAFSIILILTVVFRPKFENEEIEGESFYEYQYFEHNHKLDTSTIGMVTIAQKLGEFEYLSTEDEDFHMLISNFGETEYKCVGSCYCVEQGNRRSTSLSSSSVRVGQGLIYLLTAMSASIAYKTAKDHYYDQKCEEEYTCSEGLAIKSEVEDCEEANAQSMHQEGLKEFEKDAYKKSENYLCQGRCITNKEALNTGTAIRAILDQDNPAREINCNDLEKDAYIYVDPDVLRVKESEMETARWLFQEAYLKSYCKEMSRVEEKVPYVHNGKKYTLTKDVHLCFGAYEDITEGYINRKIFCRKARVTEDMKDVNLDNLLKDVKDDKLLKENE